jgi:hypothetical protein
MQAEGDDKKTYAWSYDDKSKKINCCESTKSSCTVSKLWEVVSLTEFHDAEIQQATKEINGIVEELRRTNRDSSRELHLIQIEDRHLLAWVHSDLVGAHSGDAKVTRMLRLKDEAPMKAPTRRAPARKAPARQRQSR